MANNQPGRWTRQAVMKGIGSAKIPTGIELITCSNCRNTFLTDNILDERFCRYCGTLMEEAKYDYMLTTGKRITHEKAVELLNE